MSCNVKRKFRGNRYRNRNVLVTEDDPSPVEVQSTPTPKIKPSSEVRSLSSKEISLCDFDDYEYTGSEFIM